MLKITNLSLSFTHKQIFSNANLTLNKNEKVAVIGPNGCGKSTLLKLILQSVELDEGIIYLQKSVVVGYVPQVVGNLDQTIESIVLHYTQKHLFEKALSKISNIEIRYSRRLESFSGGEQIKILVAIALSNSPNLLLFDEPTNHLDTQAQKWLADFVKNFRGSVIAVSHDKTFVNSFASSIYEIDKSTINKYAGNYNDYLLKKETEQANAEANFKSISAKQKKLKANWFEIAANQGAVIRKKPKAKDKDKMGFDYRAENAGEKQAKRLHQLERRIEATQAEKVELPKSIIINNPSTKEKRKLLLQFQNTSLQLPNNKIVKVEDISIYNSDKVFVSGANGSGKTTLLNSIVSGSLKVKYQNIHRIELLDQNDLLSSSKSRAVEYFSIQARCNEGVARSYLHRLLLSQDEIMLPLSKLSAGQRIRIRLTLIILSNPELLLLDEPTNHLDIRSRAVVQKLLQEYNKAYLIVSHDKELINSLGINKTIQLGDTKPLKESSKLENEARELISQVKNLNIRNSNDRSRARYLRLSYRLKFDELDQQFSAKNIGLGQAIDEWLEYISTSNEAMAVYQKKTIIHEFNITE